MLPVWGRGGRTASEWADDDNVTSYMRNSGIHIPGTPYAITDRGNRFRRRPGGLFPATGFSQHRESERVHAAME